MNLTSYACQLPSSEPHEHLASSVIARDLCLIQRVGRRSELLIIRCFSLWRCRIALYYGVLHDKRVNYLIIYTAILITPAQNIIPQRPLEEFKHHGMNAIEHLDLP